jgi:hypothetical protein
VLLHHLRAIREPRVADSWNVYVIHPRLPRVA